MTVQNAFEDLALEHVGVDGDEHMVGMVRKRYRRDFTDPTLSDWDKVDAVSTGGSDWTVNAATGIVTVGMGTTIGAEKSLLSKQMFKLPALLQVGVKLSQKIANNQVYIELVACDPVTGAVDETVVAAWRIAGSDSVTTTVARSEIRNGHTARIQSPNLTIGAITTDGVLALLAKTESLSFMYRAFNTNTVLNISQHSDANSLDPDDWYKIRLRCKNGAVAPASNTLVTFTFVTLVDHTENRVEVTGGNGQGDIANSIPVSVVNSGGVTVPSMAASASVTGLTATKLLSTASTNATLVKSSAGRVYGYQFANLTAAWKYVRFFNKATAPTPGTDAPLMVVAIPPNGCVDLNLAVPITFATGIGYTITGGVADLNATAVAANDVQGTLLWI